MVAFRKLVGQQANGNPKSIINALSSSEIAIRNVFPLYRQ